MNTLYLIPTPLAEDALDTIPAVVLETVRACDTFVVEQLKTARRFIKAICRDKDIDACTFIELDKHHGYSFDEQAMYTWKDKKIGLLSEAGMPAVADPGHRLVALAHEMNWKVVSLPGPNSMMLALAGSGFNGQEFSFHGYLPIDDRERRQKIQQMEAQARKGVSQLFMDTPYRNRKTWQELMQVLSPMTLLCVAADLTSKTAFLKTKAVADWKKQAPDLHKKPCIFILGTAR